jgi:predicted amidohydrolase
MFRIFRRIFVVLLVIALSVSTVRLPAEETVAPDILSNSADGWTHDGPRKDALPKFQFLPTGGPDQTGSLVTSADHRKGLHGWWQRTVPVEGGRSYRFSAVRKVVNVEYPRRTAVARIFWKDEKGNSAIHDFEATTTYREGHRPVSEPEYPADGPEQANGWTEVSGTFRCPSNATQARIELSFRWADKASVEWANVKLETIETPPTRKVRLATVHFAPAAGKTNEEKCQQFAPLIARAAEQKADLIVLPETLTYFNAGRTLAECAESIPGPSTDYFGQLAQQHDLYIVAGLVERDQHRIFNVAVLIGPDGQVVGKYRKVALPRTEIDAGVEAGDDYPVFETRFGKVGMMVCYDGFYPEVARELSNRGAEVIAFPVWGCNPLLASARACENHVYVVSSTYSDIKSDWMITAIYSRDGRPLAKAKDWGDVVVSEVDLGQPAIWHSLGDFRAEVLRHRPPVKPEVP